MKFMLIIIVMVLDGGAHVAQVPMESMALCEVAAKKATYAPGTGAYRQSDGFCIQVRK